MVNWIKRFINWLFQPKLTWLTVVVLGASWLIAFSYGISEIEIRLMGLLLQLAGLATVVWGIRDTRKLFGKPGLFDLTRIWLSQFPPFKPKPNNGMLNITMPMPSLHGRMHADFTVGEEASVERRLELLEQHMKLVDERITHTQSEMDRVVGEQDKDLKQEKAEREKTAQDINEKLIATETGGLNISVMGAVWLFFGLIMGTASQELFNLLQQIAN